MDVAVGGWWCHVRVCRQAAHCLWNAFPLKLTSITLIYGISMIVESWLPTISPVSFVFLYFLKKNFKF